MKLDRFDFEGIPEKASVEVVGDGYRVKAFCKDVNFSIDNIKAITDFNILFYANNIEQTEVIGKKMRITGIVCKPDNDGNRRFVALSKEFI